MEGIKHKYLIFHIVNELEGKKPCETYLKSL